MAHSFIERRESAERLKSTAGYEARDALRKGFQGETEPYEAGEVVKPRAPAQSRQQWEEHYHGR